MAQSDDFGRLITDIVGRDGLREASNRTGISAAYIGAMKRGHVPASDKIAEFLAGYRVTGESVRRVYEAAAKADSTVNAEDMIQAACDAAGMSTTGRLHVLETFRRELEGNHSHESAKSAA